MPETTAIHIIGIDCATDAKKVGLARCTFRDGRTHLDQVSTGKTWEGVDAIVASWIAGPTLLALDAPLGWPGALGPSLQAHRAGDGLQPSPNAMFRRATDDAVAARLRKRPLDVGSDRIARTAHAALSFLSRLRRALEIPIPLAWHPDDLRARADAVRAIEVYPAGTLAARGLTHSGYKGSSAAAAAIRRQLVSAIRDELALDAAAVERMAASDHALDAALCVCAGLDFVAGIAVGPDDADVAEREGWIWVRAEDRHHP